MNSHLWLVIGFLLLSNRVAGQDAILADYLAVREAYIRQKQDGPIDSFIESKVDTAARLRQQDSSNMSNGNGAGNSLSACSVSADRGAQVRIYGDLIVSCKSR